MKNNLLTKENAKNSLQTAFKPLIFDIKNTEEKVLFERLLEKEPLLSVYEELTCQLEELIKFKFPKKKFSSEEMQAEITSHLNGINPEEYGLWVYYPWSNRLVHIVEKEEFILLRTSRNHYKITPEEKEILRNKKIGVIGLSVGQSVALTMCMERICGEIRLADFDVLELTNLNRIRTGIHNLGLRKVYSVAREIAEIDPFINVICFPEGLHDNNLDAFFTEGGKLDLVIEESDGFDIKILSRIKAKELGVPVVMEASDRCMVDVERFDIEPQRPILHGLVKHLDVATLKQLKTNEDKIPYMLDILGIDTCSTRLKASMLEIDQTINTWPQLASAVTMGGGITADVSRRILLNQYDESGRYHIDIEELIGNKNNDNQNYIKENYQYKEYSYPELELQKMIELAKQTGYNSTQNIPADILNKIMVAASLAPSAGNHQPWKWLWFHNVLFQFHDKKRSYCWTDYKEITSTLALGSNYENMYLAASNFGYEAQTHFYPLGYDNLLVSATTFLQKNTVNPKDKRLFEGLSIRCTNRKLGNRQPIPISVLDEIQQSVAYDKKLDLEWITDSETISSIASLVAGVEKLRLLIPQGHYELFKKELRWSKEEIESTKDGLDVRTLELSVKDTLGLQVASEPLIISKLNEWKGGGGLENISKKGILSASAVGIVRYAGKAKQELFDIGRAVERLWTEANIQKLSFHPISSPVFILPRIANNDIELIPEHILPAMNSYLEEYRKIIPDKNDKTNVFLFRLHFSEEATVRSLRRNINDLFFTAETNN